MSAASAPGKAVLAGEWSVLEAGNPAVAAAVEPRVTVVLHDRPEGGVRFLLPTLELGPLDAVWRDGTLAFEKPISPREKKGVRFLKAVVEDAAPLLGGAPALELESKGGAIRLKGAGSARKIGLGSSAAACAAAAGALLRRAGEDIAAPAGRHRVFRLAAAAHFRAQGFTGSAVDVAASVFGGYLAYVTFDPAWLRGRIEAGEAAGALLEQPWPRLRVEALAPPAGLCILLGWTGRSASTPGMVRAMRAWQGADPGAYRLRMGALAESVDAFLERWKANDRSGVVECARDLARGLKALGDSSGVEIETPELEMLRTLAERAGGAGKPSGAGGGDLGVAFAGDDETDGRVRASWLEAGIEPLEATPADGVRPE